MNKLFIVVIFISLILYIQISTAGIVEDQALKIRNESGEWNETIYAHNVLIWTYQNIKYKANLNCDVKSAELTMREQTGDCSEYSVLVTQMLKSQGIDAWIVHGDIIYQNESYYKVVKHDTVEFRVNDTTKIIDGEYLPKFVKNSKRGLFPCEFIRTA